MRFAAAISVILLGCGPSTPRSAVSAFDLRVGVASDVFASLSAKDQERLRRGKIRLGMPEVAAYFALGTPTFHWGTRIGENNCKVLLYSRAGSPTEIDRALYSCRGIIAHQAAISPVLPCWRVAQVGPRIIENAEYFDRQTLARQWEMVIGVLERGQKKKDVYIGFGKPYNSGIEVREDGTNASTQVFLDHGGESYGLYITLVDNAVAGWKLPPDRVLTPEAQKRRMEAMEKRLMDKLRKMDELAERRHQETVGYLNEVLANQEEMKDTLTRIDANVENVLSNQDVMMANQEQMLGNQEQMLGNQGEMLGNQGEILGNQGRKHEGEGRSHEGGDQDDAAGKPDRTEKKGKKGKGGGSGAVKGRGVPSQDDDMQKFLDNDPDTQIERILRESDQECLAAVEKANTCRAECPTRNQAQEQCTTEYRAKVKECSGSGKKACIKELRAERQECSKRSGDAQKNCLADCADPQTVCEPISEQAKADIRAWEKKKKKKK